MTLTGSISSSAATVARPHLFACRHGNAHVASVLNVPATANLRLLLVEPHADSGDMYAEYFRYHGVSVMTVSNAFDALAAVSDANVVVTNIRLPGEMDGIELIARLRRDERTEHIPIAVLSASTFSGDRTHARHAEGDVFLTKPCLPDVLLRHARRLFLRSKLKHVRRKTAKRDTRQLRADRHTS